MHNLITEALAKTEKGRAQILKVKEYRKNKIGGMRKLRALKELAHTVLVKSNYNKSLYQIVKPFIYDLCMKNTDEQYQKAFSAFKEFKQRAPKKAEKFIMFNLKMPL